ncbi:MAG: quinone oxidoreductase family protein [Rickettsiales bacterium]
MVDAIQFARTGGPDVLQLAEVTLAAPGPGQVRLRHTAIGLNFIDTYHRSGLYPVPLPATPGMEAAGVVEVVGEGVNLAIGTRVVYGRGPMGAYASARLIAARECVVIPEGVSDAVAASALLKGLTAWYLLHETFPVKKGDTILVHAAAGGVGLILCQWAKQLGCRVIGTAGSAEKASLACEHGCDEVILYRNEKVAERVRALTGGEGVPVVYDAVGASTFIASLDSLQPKGMMVSYGQASGVIPPFDLRELAGRGSLFITRPSLMDYVRDDATYQRAATALLARIARDDIRVGAAQQFALKDAASAHRALEARETKGSTVLVPAMPETGF